MYSPDNQVRSRSAVLAVAIIILLVASPLAAALGEIPSDASETRSGNAMYRRGDLLVVAPGDWLEKLELLMDWRNRTSGYIASFISYEDTQALGNGHDPQARLKDMIGTMGGSANAPEALLLVGDSEVIPVRMVFTDILGDGNVYDPLNRRWTDDYYIYGNASTWDRDGDHIYGEDGEVLEEVHHWISQLGSERPRVVGRIPASTALEVERFVDKLLAYERNPPPGDWYTSALVVSGLMDVPNHLDNPYTPGLDGGYELFSDNSYESHERLLDILPDRYSTTWLWDYPYLEGGHWNLSVDTLDHTSIVGAFDQGHSIVAMNGHGWDDGSGLAHYNGSGYSDYWWDWSTAFDYDDADFVRNGGMLPWTYVAACYVGDITVANDKTLERLVMNPNGGAIGLVAGNGENYKGESQANASYGNWFLERTYWRNYLEHGPGLAMHLTKVAYLDLVSGDGVPHKPLYDAYYVADYLSPNLLGDPLTRVWTDTPGTLELDYVVDHPNDNYDQQMEVRVVDGSGNPVEGAMVFVSWGPDNSRWTELTDEDGRAIPNAPLGSEELEIVVSAPNHLPLEVKMDRPHDEPDLELTDLWWNSNSPSWMPALPDTPVTFHAQVQVNGRYAYDQARVRWSVAPPDGAFERILPDMYLEVGTGVIESTILQWTPTASGTWRVMAEVDPLDELPNADGGNDVIERELVVMGPPSWAGLPAEVSLDCEDGPGAIIDLSSYVQDTDTPVADLDFLVRVVDDPGEDVQAHLTAPGVLSLCTDVSNVTVGLELTVDDGTWSDIAQMTVHLQRVTGPLRIAGDLHLALSEGDLGTGALRIEGYGPVRPVDAGIYEVADHPLFTIAPDGTFTIDAETPGTHIVELAIRRSDGSADEDWADASLVFRVLSADLNAPDAINWQPVTVAAGEVARLHLQAVDLEGGDVTYSIVDDQGLGASVDSVTGMLALRPPEDGGGDYQVTVLLSDGVNKREAILQVQVTGEESGSGGWAVALVVIVGVLVVFIIVKFYSLLTSEDPESLRPPESPEDPGPRDEPKA